MKKIVTSIFLASLVVIGIVNPASAGAAQVPVGSRVVFTGDYESGNAHQWQTCQNKTYNGSCAGYKNSFYGMRVAGGGQQRQGKYAARYEVRNGDVPGFGGGERSEVSQSGAASVKEGDERYYQFSLKFDPSFTNPTSNFFIVMQWHSGSGSPPLALMVNRSGQLQLTNNATNKNTKTIGAVKRGAWADYVLHVKFSRNASVGFDEVYQDGALVVPKHSRPTMSSSSCYLKQGIYRSASETSTAVVWQDGLRVTAP
jgi:Polysaccharide lyase